MSELLQNFGLRALPPEAEAFRATVKQFLREHQPPAEPSVRARSWMGFDACFSRALADRGWVGVTLPARYGGANLDAFSRFVLVEELLVAGAPVAAHWVADRQSGPLVLKYGTEAQRDFYLPRICAGQAFFCIGMSEPGSGSDLASIATRVRPDGNGWRLDGQKIWTTNAQHCQYMIALVRSSGSTEDRHHGLSQVIVDLSLPGITIRPIRDLNGDAHFSEVFFDDVRLPADALIGQEGHGWEQVTAELAFERSGPERIYSSIVLLDHWIACLRTSPHGAERHAGTVGLLTVQLATLRHMCIAVTGKLVDGASPVVEAALVKDMGTTFEQSIPTLIEDALGAWLMDPEVDVDPELIRAVAHGVHIAPTFSLRGGTREVLRGMIARGLGLR